MRVMLDTNVILDFFLAREPYQDAVKEIFRLAYQEKIEACTTANSITDIYYIVAKRLGDVTARDVLLNLFNIITVFSVNGEDCISALSLPMADYEDAVISTCAYREDMDFIITNDADFLSVESPLVNIVDPVGFLNLL